MASFSWYRALPLYGFGLVVRRVDIMKEVSRSHDDISCIFFPVHSVFNDQHAL
jgi:hypothetical protein